MIAFSRCDCSNENFIGLTKCLDAELDSIYGRLQRGFYNQFNTVSDIPTAIVAFDGDMPVGCGCFKSYGDRAVEIKRMYVKPEYRGRGISKKIMELLEGWAAELGNTRAVLETGKKQTEAIGLYKKAGYSMIENYGSYAGQDNSICFGKELI